MHFHIFIGPLYVWLGLLILIRQLSLYVLPVRSIRVWSGPWFNVQTGATGIFGSLHVVRNRSSLGNVARPQSCVPSSSVSKRGSSELACLEWLSGGLGCQTLPCLRFSGSLSERGRVGRAWCACACISSFAASSPAAASRSLARGKPQTPARPPPPAVAFPPSVPAQ